MSHHRGNFTMAGPLSDKTLSFMKQITFIQNYVTVHGLKLEIGK